MDGEQNAPLYLDDETDALTAWCQAQLDEGETPFAAAQRIVRRLGAHVRDGVAEFGFWAPELALSEQAEATYWLEIYHPTEEPELTLDRQNVRFRRTRLPMQRQGEYLWAAVANLQPGSREHVGDFYWVGYTPAPTTTEPAAAGEPEDDAQILRDPLAYSLPLGAFAPAELYDMGAMLAGRADSAHFHNLPTAPDADGVARITPPVNILQLHIGTASADKTLAGLTEIYRTIAAKIEREEALTPAEQNYVGYDAVQLMPIEPAIEFENAPSFWQIVEDHPDSDLVTVNLRKPDMTNWGYDVVMTGSAAINPVVLGSRRPDEFLDFIETLHNFAGGPIKVVLDIVYGHIDNQALPLLGAAFFAGRNMYGQNVNFSHPVVRALLLEMQRRKQDYGVDGVRVDGAQDFKVWDAERETLYHDDDYLGLMNNIEQEVAGVRYRPWMIFEDGRPWPAPDWEISSTYCEVTRRYPNVWQWGPLTFAHNTPFLFTFWIAKWWRIEEIAAIGRNWITGCANHDTLRRGAQVDPQARYNTYLGDSLPEIFRNGYDNPATNLFNYAMMPGVPMDFINASMRAPWSFIRNTDDRYGVKVMSEEARFMDWAVSEEDFARPGSFGRLKALGFATYGDLHRFMHVLDHLVQATDHDLDAISAMLNVMEPPLAGPDFSASVLKTLARAWMDDVYDYCNVALYAETVDRARSDFNHAVRVFRRQRPWLIDNLRDDEHFAYLKPCEGTVLFYGLRRAPDSEARVLFAANMEGMPYTFVPRALPIPDLPQEGWRPALGAEGSEAHAEVTLRNGEGVVFVWGE